MRRTRGACPRKAGASSALERQQHTIDSRTPPRRLLLLGRVAAACLLSLPSRCGAAEAGSGGSGSGSGAGSAAATARLLRSKGGGAPAAGPACANRSVRSYASEHARAIPDPDGRLNTWRSYTFMRGAPRPAPPTGPLTCGGGLTTRILRELGLSEGAGAQQYGGTGRRYCFTDNLSALHDTLRWNPPATPATPAPNTSQSASWGSAPAPAPAPANCYGEGGSANQRCGALPWAYRGKLAVNNGNYLCAPWNLTKLKSTSQPGVIEAWAARTVPNTPDGKHGYCRVPPTPDGSRYPVSQPICWNDDANTVSPAGAYGASITWPLSPARKKQDAQTPLP